MSDVDFEWAAALMERRRERYAEYSPVFWRPALGITASHGEFLRSIAKREGSIAFRSDHGFVISYENQGRCFVDDFAVEGEDQWATEGKNLVLNAWNKARSPRQSTLRVVTARLDQPKRDMLAALGLLATARWWVKELRPTRPPQAPGPVDVAGRTAMLIQAPPVYDPGGPVLLLGDLEVDSIDAALAQAATLGAVLAIVQRDGGVQAVSDSEPGLEEAGFHNASEFYGGRPSERS
jgi:hypothetical protein